MKTIDFGRPIDKTWLQSTMMVMVMVIVVLVSLVFAFQIRPNGFNSLFNITQKQEIKEESKSTDFDSKSNQAEVSNHLQYPERTFSAKHVFQLLLIGTLIIWGYSLVMSGKNGQGWAVLILLLGMLKYIGRFIRSLFVEVTSKNEVRDWDDD